MHAPGGGPRLETDKKIVIMDPEQRRGVWTEILSKEGFPLVAQCAERLMCMHASAAASERNWSVWGQIYTKYRTRLELKKGEKLAYIRGNTAADELADPPDLFSELEIAPRA